ncbi:general stress protein [Paenibacillus silvisoli]|uniref:general stress protein n=1 Tax=Paenibacillus silvisoli TaxID=3110539 RepID=UPI0028063DD1|nr:general stress protein [Paenibacillus silvisoli]
MTYKIGIFNTENEAVAAVQALEQAGFTRTELRVMAKDRDHSRRIEAETDVHADEMTDLLLTRAVADDHSVEDLRVLAPGAPVSGLGMAGGYIGSLTFPSNGFLVAAALLDDDHNVERALSDIGLSSSDTAPCRDALARGAIIVAADLGDSEQADGPDLSRGGAAEAALRSCGAARIL